MPKTIFVASSSEAKAIAKRIAQGLSSAGFNVIRWWTTFEAGDVTITRLMQLAKKADGGVFVFSNDDKTWSRGKQLNSTRDNTLLEYGLFLGNLDLTKCYVVRDQSVKIPSDISGVTLPSLSDDLETVKEQCVDHFKGVFSKRPELDEEILVNADPAIVEVETFQHVKADFLLRACYLGTEGARSWCDLASSRDYVQEGQPSVFSTAVLQLLSDFSTKLDTLISLGPGDARLDLSIVKGLVLANPQIQYVPIDINSPMLKNAIKKIGKVASVPFGIHSDFEGNFDFVAEKLRKLGQGKRLTSILGNTFGNFDSNESAFLSSISEFSVPGDLLLIGAAANRVESIDIAASDLDKSMKEFIANGIVRHKNISKHEAVSQFDNICGIAVIDNFSVIPETKTLCVFDLDTKSAYGYINRYSAEHFGQYFENSESRWKIVGGPVLQPFSDQYSELFVLLERTKEQIR